MGRDSLDTFFDKTLFKDGFVSNFAWNKFVPGSNPYYGQFYYMICKMIAARFIVEIGIDRGHSSYYMGMAAKENGGLFVGVEILKGRADKVKQAMNEMGIPNKIVVGDTKTFTSWEHSPQIDFILLDGEHSREAVLNEIKIVYPKLHRHSVVAIHDVYSIAADAYYHLLNDDRYNFHHIEFPGNYGLALLVKQDGNWMEMLKSRTEHARMRCEQMYHLEGQSG